MRLPAFVHSIRFRLLLVSASLLAIPWLAAQFIGQMEAFLRASQETAITGTARAVASALSDRPRLFEKPESDAVDPEAEERRRIVALFAAADPGTAARLGAAYVPSEEVERFIDIMGRTASRIWVVDTRSRVRGLSGSLKEPAVRGAPAREAATMLAGWLKPVVEWVVSAPVVAPGDESKPVRAQIDRALIGVSTTNWRGTKERDTAILSAAQPIFAGDEIVGAVVVEETTGAIQLLKATALENLVAMTLLVSFGAFLVLFLFASRLVTRIRRLARDAEAAIDPQGRFRGALPGSQALDEIGDLSRAFSAVLVRLKDYNATLEAMAGRLSHELRTPVAVVRSSLDNLRHEAMGDAAKTYLERAEEGTQRLSTLISRLSEATRLEKMLESAARERFDLARVVGGCVEGYRAAFPSRDFTLQLPGAPVAMTGVPDAIAQLLDKLVDNANDFATAGTPVRVSLVVEEGRAVLAVANDGPPLPEGLAEGLFDAMVSVRPDSAGAHLGLGLTIARLVATAHGGEITARNIPGGVEVKVHLKPGSDTQFGVRDVTIAGQ